MPLYRYGKTGYLYSGTIAGCRNSVHYVGTTGADTSARAAFICVVSWAPAYSPAEFARLFGRQETWSYRQAYAGKVRVIGQSGRMMIPRFNAAGDTAKTIAPVQVSPATDAEFCDSPSAFLRFDLRRLLLYELHTRGPVAGVSLRRRGTSRGKRLWSIDSIRCYLASQMESLKGGRK
jgi:hypothetical protein